MIDGTVPMPDLASALPPLVPGLNVAGDELLILPNSAGPEGDFLSSAPEEPALSFDTGLLETFASPDPTNAQIPPDHLAGLLVEGDALWLGDSSAKAETGALALMMASEGAPDPAVAPVPGGGDDFGGEHNDESDRSEDSPEAIVVTGRRLQNSAPSGGSASWNFSLDDNGPPPGLHTRRVSGRQCDR